MQKMTMIPIILFTFIFGTALVSLQTSNAQSVNYTTFTNTDLGFSFEYPSNWEVEEKTNRFDTVPDVVVKDGLQQFKVLAMKSSMNQEGVDYFGSLKNLVQTIPTPPGERPIGDVEENKYIIDGEDTASLLTVLESYGGFLDLALEKIVVLHGDVLYVVGFQHTTQQFDSPKSQEVFSHIIESFRFIDSSDAEGEDGDVGGSEDGDD